MAEAVVEFDYDAVNGDELTLHKGTIIKNINMMEGGWWEGEINGKTGMFPDNFVKVIEKPASAPKQTVPPSSSTPSSSLSSSSSMKSHGPGPVANGDVSLGSQETGDAAKVKTRDDQISTTEGGSKKRKMRAKVTFSYSPQNEDELELIVNDTVEVIDQPEEGWWEGVIKGKHGLFPSNFVSIVDEDNAQDTKSETPAVSSSGGTTPMEEDKPVKKVNRVGHGNIFAGGMPQLRKTPTPDKDVRTQAKAESHPFALKRMSLRKKENDEKKDEEKKDDKHSSSAESKGIFKVRVIYDYEPKNADELQLKKGEIVTVIDKDAGDSGWWKGEINGKVGVFPDNFTEEIPEEKTKKQKNMPAPVPARPQSGIYRGSGDDHHSISAPLRPTRPGSMELKGSQKPPVAKQPSQDSKSAPKESNVNGSRHLPPGAKQVLPPPTAGRPQVFNKPSGLSKPPAATKPHEVKETPKDATDSGKTDPKETTFDNIKINTEKLTHLNLSRPKATPNRRPPSTIGVPTAAASSSSNTPLSSLTSPPPTNTSPPPDTVDAPTPYPSSSHTDDEPKQPPPWSRDIKKSLRRKPVALPPQDKSAENGSVPPPGRPKASPSQTSSSSTPATDTSSAAPPRPVGGVPKTTTSNNSSPPASKDAASSTEVQDLKKEIKSLHDIIASIKTDFKKEVKKLMTEVDEEKKHRMMMQVELERIKKLVMEGD